MARVSGMLTEDQIKGKPKDIMETIYTISPTDTPFLSLCKENKDAVTATQTKHVWTTDELFPPTDNARVEGAETTEFEASVVKEMENTTQILMRAVQLSGTAQAVKQAGVQEQFRLQMARRVKELKKDLEFALLSNQTAVSGASDTARRMRGLPTFIDKNVNLGSGGAVGTETAPAQAGTLRNLTEDMLKGVIRQCYEAGGNVTKIMAAPAIRSAISTILRGGPNRTDSIEQTKVTATVEVYVSDYGNITVEPNRVQAAVPYTKNAVLLLDPEYWHVAFLRDIEKVDLSKTGDSIKAHVLCEATLQASQPDSSGMIADIRPIA